jgi:hypothetical protein
MTALHYLAEKGDAHVMEARVNVKGGKLPLMEALIVAKADMNLLDSVSLLLAFVLPWMIHLIKRVIKFDVCDSLYAGGGVRSLPHHCLDAAVLMFSFLVATCLVLLQPLSFSLSLPLSFMSSLIQNIVSK